MHLSMTHGETIVQPSRAADGASLDLLPNLAIECSNGSLCMEDVRGKKKVKRSPK